MKVLSLFDGISCARVALQKAGIPVEVYYASEIDVPALRISNKNWPEIVQLGDIKTIHERFDLDENFGNGIDLLIGGSPCQDLSIATKNRQGLKGSRSGLFWDYVRILEKVKPKYFILENVASMSKEAREAITEALGGVQPIMINTSLVSAQSRKRLFWTNIPNIVLPEDRNIFLKDILQTGDIPITKYGLEKLKSNTVRTGGRGSGIDDKHNWDTIRLGQIGKGSQGDRVYDVKGKSVTLSAGGGGLGAKTGLYLIVPEATKKGFALAGEGDSVDLSFPNSKTRRGRVGNKVKNLMTSQNIGVFTQGYVRKLTTVECERLQGLPDRYTEGVSDAQRYKMLGNAFNADVVAHILSFIHRGVVYKGK